MGRAYVREIFSIKDYLSEIQPVGFSYSKNMAAKLFLTLITLTGAMAARNQLNIYGENLEVCSMAPLTGWFRDGYCNTDKYDTGVHVICGTMTEDVSFDRESGIKY